MSSVVPNTRGSSTRGRVSKLRAMSRAGSARAGSSRAGSARANTETIKDFTVGTVTNPCETVDKELFYEGTKKLVTDNNITKGRGDMFDCIVIKNTYVDACLQPDENPQRQPGSFYSLISRQLSQGDAIKLGYAIERIFRQLISTNPNLRDIRPQTKKGEKEKDHLFQDKNTGHIYYAEVKSNIYLDTEKIAKTLKKIDDVIAQLQDTYKSHDGALAKVTGYLFAPRYFKRDIIPAAKIAEIRGLIERDNLKYFKVDNLVGVNEYMTELGVKYDFDSEEIYREKLNYLAYRMFDCINYIKPGTYDDTAISEEYTTPRKLTKKHENIADVPDAPRKSVIRTSTVKKQLNFGNN
jgi:hypothetical protein